jgi:hypothetical protein
MHYFKARQFFLSLLSSSSTLALPARIALLLSARRGCSKAGLVGCTVGTRKFVYD